MEIESKFLEWSSSMCLSVCYHLSLSVSQPVTHQWCNLFFIKFYYGLIVNERAFITDFKFFLLSVYLVFWLSIMILLVLLFHINQLVRSYGRSTVYSYLKCLNKVRSGFGSQFHLDPDEKDKRDIIFIYYNYYNYIILL